MHRADTMTPEEKGEEEGEEEIASKGEWGGQGGRELRLTKIKDLRMLPLPTLSKSNTDTTL